MLAAWIGNVNVGGGGLTGDFARGNRQLVRLDESESMSKLRHCANTKRQDTQDVDVHAEAVAEIHENCCTEVRIDACRDLRDMHSLRGRFGNGEKSGRIPGTRSAKVNMGVHIDYNTCEKSKRQVSK